MVVQESYRVRFIDPDDSATLVNLYHLARTALSGEKDQGRHARMCWATTAFLRERPGYRCGSGGVYKDLSGLLT